MNLKVYLKKVADLLKKVADLFLATKIKDNPTKGWQNYNQKLVDSVKTTFNEYIKSNSFSNVICFPMCIDILLSDEKYQDFSSEIQNKMAKHLVECFYKSIKDWATKVSRQYNSKADLSPVSKYWTFTFARGKYGKGGQELNDNYQIVCSSSDIDLVDNSKVSDEGRAMNVIMSVTDKDRTTYLNGNEVMDIWNNMRQNNNGKISIPFNENKLTGVVSTETPKKNERPILAILKFPRLKREWDIRDNDTFITNMSDNATTNVIKINHPSIRSRHFCIHYSNNDSFYISVTTRGVILNQQIIEPGTRKELPDQSTIEIDSSCYFEFHKTH